MLSIGIVLEYTPVRDSQVAALIQRVVITKEGLIVSPLEVPTITAKTAVIIVRMAGGPAFRFRLTAHHNLMIPLP